VVSANIQFATVTQETISRGSCFPR